MSNRSAWTPTDVAFHNFLLAADGLALRSGHDLYPSVQLALNALPWLEEHSVLVLGFDGLNTDGQWIHPSMDHIADFSSLLEEDKKWKDQVRRSLEHSHRVLSEWLGNVQFIDFAIVAEDGIDQLQAEARRLSS
jgi:hypothetical protein